jgi:signal transduction histidine kinase
MEATEQLTFLKILLPFAGIAFIIGIGAILINQQFRKKLQDEMLKQEELKNQHQLNLLRSSIQVQEAERKRIAQDLHDELGATLSIARMQLVQLMESHSDNKTLESALMRVQQATEASLASMRRISHQLMPPQLERFGLIVTLETVAAQLNATGGKLNMTITTQQMDRLPAPIELGLYRACMELTNNTIKHAGATQINIQLTQTSTQLMLLEFRDNGVGIPEARTSKGLGLNNIEAHVSALSGTVNFHLGATDGFCARIEIPI